ncbi:LOW QUALITY PROTEIN: scoloptoxin SSD14 [Procambarus clarkii]|uniref:LOW QUALITY PROTEIN: scoloptoxin SSD14 n=1 Tax=Procambarus clarkii TaxID=6728 RepID=UPI003742F634
MGRRSKRLRSQLYQYAQDEAGSYSVITQWQPPPSTTTPPTELCEWSRRCLVTSAVAVALSCLALLALGVILGLTQGGSGGAPGRSTTLPSEPGGLWKTFNGREEEAAKSSSAPSSASHLGQFFKAAVATDGGQPCAHIATEILAKNGSAADATVAGLFCAGVINAQSMGVGGGFLLTYYERATGHTYTLDAMTSDRSQGDAGHEDGGVSWVPGAVRGYRVLYEKLGGQVAWADLLEPSIRLCEEGHPVSGRLARALHQAAGTVYSHPSMRVFVSPSSGEVYREGETMRRPQLARTLRLLQRDPDALYTGALAKDLLHDLDNMGASLTSQDLQGYRPSWEDPVSVRLHNGSFTLYTAGPPGSGIALGFLLNLIDEFGFTPGSVSDRNTVLTYHRLAEAFKWTLAQPADAAQLAHITSDDFAASVRRQILDDTTFHDSEHYGASPGTVGDPGAIPTSVGDCGTSHFSLLAPNGDAVSVTSAIYKCLGRWVRLPRTGIVVSSGSSRGGGPSLRPAPEPSRPTPATPGRRGISSLIPAVVVDTRGDVVMVAGGTGGGAAPSGVWWAVLRSLWLGEDLGSAVDAPRFHLRMQPMTLVYERELSPRLVTALQSLGHRTEEEEEGGEEGSAVYAIVRAQNGKVQAVADHRRAGGAVDGF